MTRAAVVQDWFFAPGGSEQVAMELAGLLPNSDVFSSFADAATKAALGRRLHTWPLQRVLGPTQRYRSLLPLYPIWFARLDLREYDLVLSSSSAFAKAVRTRRDATHVSYVHTPMRYAWDLNDYLAGSSVPILSRVAARTLQPALQRWDRSTSRRPDVLVANSEVVRQRIRRLWGRDAEVIHPPVRMDDIGISTIDEGFLLVVARLVAYRRIDLLVRTATQRGLRLVVVGDGPERTHLEGMAGSTVSFLTSASRAEVVDLYGRCHAYVVPGEEDFGMAPVEAMAGGKPVVAFRAGGAQETVIEGKTGVFFDHPTPEALAAAVDRLDTIAFDPDAIRANAQRFAPEVFRSKFVELFRRLGIDPYRSQLTTLPAVDVDASSGE